MYGLIGSMKAVEGKRDDLVEILLESTTQMPGCHSYIVATDPDDADRIWITEVWDTSENHRASLKLPEVKSAIERAMPFIASFEKGTVTTPIGGHGLAL